MKLKELLDVASGGTWLRVVDNETNGDYEELFVRATDWIGGDRATRDRVQPLLDRRVEDITSCVGGTPEDDDALEPMVVVNLEARQSAKIKFDVACERRFVQHVVVEAESQKEAERLALERMADVRPQDADIDSRWRVCPLK